MQTTQPDSKKVAIRWMILGNLPEVLELERKSSESHWSEKELCHCLKQTRNLCRVAIDHDRIVGYVIYERQRDHINILKLAVHPDFRKQGIGTQLVENLASQLSPHRTRLTFAVSDRDPDGQRFLRKLGVEAQPAVDTPDAGHDTGSFQSFESRIVETSGLAGEKGAVELQRRRRATKSLGT